MMKMGPRAGQADRDVWRVGVLFSRSGLMAVSESEHFFGTALAIEEINNAGGILGREIEVVAYDPGSIPETYLRMAHPSSLAVRHRPNARPCFQPSNDATAYYGTLHSMRGSSTRRM